MIRNILVGYSGQRGAQLAFSHATDIARAATARIHIALVGALTEAETAAGSLTANDPEAGGQSFPELPLLAEDDPAPMVPPAVGKLVEECGAEGIACTFNQYYGTPGARLLTLSRSYNLIVVGRRDDPRPAQGHPLGRTARHLVAHAGMPTLLTDREHLPLKSATLLYEPRFAGGRALALAGYLCSLLNISLNVTCTPYEETDAGQAEAEARSALRAYHVDGEFTRGHGAPSDALRNAALNWSDPLLVIPAPPRRLLSSDPGIVRLAVSLPNTNVLLVP
jgi:nucleotide-binding universal stress UspA family protein